MSDFSTMCKEAIKDAGLTVYQISKNSGLDRTTMQKMITGSKLPSYTFFCNFLEQLRLNDEEKSNLQEVFQIEKDGFSAYNNRKKIREMIQNLGKKQEIPPQICFNDTKLSYAENEMELLQLIYENMKSCIQTYEGVVFQMNIPQQMDLFYTVVQTLEDLGGGGKTKEQLQDRTDRYAE